MRKIQTAFFMAAFMMLLGSCERETPDAKVPEELLIGYWISPEYHDSLITYQKADGFDYGPGFEFRMGGKLTERKNDGWCGTPPVTYGNFDGTYTLSQEGMLEVVSPYWGGIIRTRFAIVSIDQTSLKLKFLESGEAK